LVILDAVLRIKNLNETKVLWLSLLISNKSYQRTKGIGMGKPGESWGKRVGRGELYITRAT